MSIGHEVGILQAVANEARSSVRWKIFLVMLVLTTFNYIDRASLSIAMPVVAPEFNLSPAMQGLLFSAFFWSYVAMLLPGGYLVDWFKPRSVIGVVTLLWGVCQMLGAACFSWVALLATRLGLGVVEAPIMPAGVKLLGAWMTPNERGRGACILDGGSVLGTAVGAILMTSLITMFDSWRMAFLITGAGTVVVGIGAWLYIRNRPDEHSGVNAGELVHITAARVATVRTTTDATRQGRFIELLRDRSVIAMNCGWICNCIVFYGLLTWLPNYLHEARGFDLKAMGGSTFIIFMTGFVGELVGGYVADKWKAAGGKPNLVMRVVFVVAGLITALGILLANRVTSATSVVVLLSVALFFLRWFGMYWCLPGLLGGQSRVGLMAASMNLFGQIMGIAVPLIVGLIVQVTHSYNYAMIFFGMAAIGLALFSSLIDYRERGVA